MAVRATKVLRIFTMIGKVKRFIHYVIILKNEEEKKTWFAAAYLIRAFRVHIYTSSGSLYCSY